MTAPQGGGAARIALAGTLPAAHIGAMPLHITKVAFGCAEVEALAARLDGRAFDGETWIDTRYRPTRHAELIGGSLHWIIKHQRVARSPILGFEEVEGRCRIRLAAGLVPVRPRLRRAHQGWRYLTEADAPTDLDGDADELGLLPAKLAGELAALMLI